VHETILIPGLGSDAAVWQPTIEALGGAACCRVGDTLSDGSLPAMARRIVEGAPRRFALAGVSMGGMVALEIMRLAPERVTKLALIDTNARPDTPKQSAQRQAANAAILEAGDLAVFAAQGISHMIDPSAGERVRRAMVEMAVRVGAATYVRQNNAMLAREDLRPVLSTIRVPTIIVVGENDVLTPLPCSEEIRDGIAGATLDVIPDCGHLPPIERPNELAPLLQEWLQPSR
jgi:pimeloyl-ACP methyl ester carboxylesterase